MRTFYCLLALLALLTIAGCPGGGQNPQPPPPGGSSTVGSETLSTAAAEPVYGGIYKFPLDTDPPTLDPAKVTDTVSDRVIRCIFDGLVRISPQGEYVGAIASSWEASPDGTVWTFHLRDNVKFQNNRQVTAEDFAYSFKRILDPNTASPRTWVLDKIKGAKDFMDGKAQDVAGIEVVDPATLKLTLSEPFAPFLGLLAMSTASAIPQEVVEQYGGEFATKPEATIGTGPFVLKDWAHNNYLLLQSNEEYYDGRPYVDGVRFIIIAEPLARLEEFRSGNLDHTDIPADVLDQVVNNPGESKLILSRPILDVYNMGFNCQKEPFKDNPKLRLAFNYAINKQHMIDNVLHGMWEQARGVVPPGIFGYDPGLTGYPYDQAKAKQLLAEAGYPDGQGLAPITLYYDSRPPRPDIAQVVQSDLASVGVKINLRQLEWSAFLEAVDAGEPAFFQLTWLADYPDPENFLYVLLDTKQWGPPGNSTRYSNTEFDRLVEEAGRITDQSRRWELYSQAERIAYEDAPWLLLFWNKCNVLVAPEVRGLDITALDRAPVLPSVEIEKVWFAAE